MAQTNDVPTARIKRQAQTTTPVTGDNTLVDDTVALVDDPTDLVGGPSTIVELQRNAIVNNAPKVMIKRYR